jgi:excisionase family DNA binding protein
MTSIAFSITTHEELREIIRTELINALESAKKEDVVNNNLPSLITRKETSKLLNVSLTTLSNWSRKGILPATKVGTRIRYRKEDIVLALKEVRNLKFKR